MLSECVEMFQQWSSSVSVNFSKPWRAWLLLIAAFVLLVVVGRNQISNIPPQLQLAPKSFVSLPLPRGT
eukprot:scaffold5368_cov206-Alexandrium_tamarense.AAC.15